MFSLYVFGCVSCGKLQAATKLQDARTCVCVCVRRKDGSRATTSERRRFCTPKRACRPFLVCSHSGEGGTDRRQTSTHLVARFYIRTYIPRRARASVGDNHHLAAEVPRFGYDLVPRRVADDQDRDVDSVGLREGQQVARQAQGCLRRPGDARQRRERGKLAVHQNHDFCLAQGGVSGLHAREAPPLETTRANPRCPLSASCPGGGRPVLVVLVGVQSSRGSATTTGSAGGVGPSTEKAGRSAPKDARMHAKA